MSAPGKTCSPHDIAGNWAPTGSGTVDGFVAANAITDHLFVVCQ